MPVNIKSGIKKIFLQTCIEINKYQAFTLWIIELLLLNNTTTSVVFNREASLQCYIKSTLSQSKITKPHLSEFYSYWYGIAEWCDEMCCRRFDKQKALFDAVGFCGMDNVLTKLSCDFGGSSTLNENFWKKSCLQRGIDLLAVQECGEIGMLLV